MNDQQFRVFFDGKECVPGTAETVTVGDESDLPEDTMGITVNLDSEADRLLQAKLRTVERARIKQEHPPIDFDGYVVILDRSWSPVTETAFYTLVPVKMPPRGPIVEGGVPVTIESSTHPTPESPDTPDTGNSVE